MVMPTLPISSSISQAPISVPCHAFAERTGRCAQYLGVRDVAQSPGRAHVPFQLRWSEHASPDSTSVLAAYPALSQHRFSTSFCVCAGWVNSPGDRAGLIVADYQLRGVPLGEHRSGGCFRSAQGPLGGTPKPEYPAERYSLLSVLGAVGDAPYFIVLIFRQLRLLCWPPMCHIFLY